MAVALDITLSMQRGLDHKMIALTNNAANAGVHGFQADRVIFSEHLGQSDGVNTYSYLDDVATVRDLKRGPLDRTGNPFHLALQSNGYFGVQTAEGIRYTRSGAFLKNPEGVLTTLSGESVLSSDGGEINIPPGSITVSIAQDGTISDESGVIAQLGVFGFENEFDIEKTGNTQFKTEQAAIPLGNQANIVQGALEGSNVSLIRNMSEMMMVSKIYGLNQRFITDAIKLESKKNEMLATSTPVI